MPALGPRTAGDFRRQQGGLRAATGFRAAELRMGRRRQQGERKPRQPLAFFWCWDKGVMPGGPGLWSPGWVLKAGGVSPDESQFNGPNPESASGWFPGHRSQLRLCFRPICTPCASSTGT